MIFYCKNALQMIFNIKILHQTNDLRSTCVNQLSYPLPKSWEQYFYKRRQRNLIKTTMLIRNNLYFSKKLDKRVKSLQQL